MTAFTGENLHEIRQRFVLPDEIYLLSHSIGRPLASMQGAWELDFLTPWEAGGDETWPQWLAAIDHFRRAMATLLNTRLANVCPQVNLSSALVKVLGSLPVDPSRNVVLCTAQAFPSMVFVARSMERLGLQLRLIPEEHNSRDLSTWAEYLTDDVAFALVTHVHSNTGEQLPAAGICALARDRGARSIVDIAQSVGCLPIDLADWQADFVLGSCVKWLCGGPGAGFLVVATDLLDQCEPMDVGWFSHADPFEFDIHHFAYAEDALRFWGGTPSVQPFVCAAHSISILDGIGIALIRQHNLELSRQLIEGLGHHAIASPLTDNERSGTVVVTLGTDADARMATLREQRIGFDGRSTGIRLSPHIYNTADEIDKTLDALTR